jgi:hypothetical protein
MSAVWFPQIELLAFSELAPRQPLAILAGYERVQDKAKRCSQIGYFQLTRAHAALIAGNYPSDTVGFFRDLSLLIPTQSVARDSRQIAEELLVKSFPDFATVSHQLDRSPL